MKWVFDENLSFKAKGILFYCSTFPFNTDFSISDLIGKSVDGEDSIRSGLKELIKRGYLTIKNERNKNGNFSKSIWKFNF